MSRNGGHFMQNGKSDYLLIVYFYELDSILGFNRKTTNLGSHPELDKIFGSLNFEGSRTLILIGVMLF